MSDEQVPELTDEQLAWLNSLFDLARNGQTEQLLAAVDAGVPVNLANHNGDTLLILAAYNDQPALVRELLARDADPNRVNLRGQTALACALFKQQADSVSALLAAGADPALGSMTAWQIVDFFGLSDLGNLLPPRDQG